MSNFIVCTLEPLLPDSDEVLAFHSTEVSEITADTTAKRLSKQGYDVVVIPAKFYPKER